jgi:hypothetical protein
MNEDNQLQDVMQPSPNSDTVSLPITFDYTVGRSESGRTRKVIAWMVSIIFFIIGLLILFRGSQNFFVRLLIVAALYTVITYSVRFLLLQEGKLRKQYYEQLDNDYKISTEDTWGIYEIDGDEIRVAHYRNGRLGIFFALEKDVIVGLDAESEFKHYEAVSDAYNEVAKNRAQIIHIDYMTHVGRDPRMAKLYEQASKSPNPDMRAVLNGIYSHLDDTMRDEISTYDAYVILIPSTEVQYNQIARKVIERFMEGNYLGYTMLSDEQIRDLTVELFNLHSFSVVDAERNALISSTYRVAVPISIEKDGVVTKLNKTVKEKREEEVQQRKLKELVEREARNRKQAEREARRNQKKKAKQPKAKKNKKVADNIDDQIIEL